MAEPQMQQSMNLPHGNNPLGRLSKPRLPNLRVSASFRSVPEEIKQQQKLRQHELQGSVSRVNSDLPRRRRPQRSSFDAVCPDSPFTVPSALVDVGYEGRSDSFTDIPSDENDIESTSTLTRPSEHASVNELLARLEQAKQQQQQQQQQQKQQREATTAARSRHQRRSAKGVARSRSSVSGRTTESYYEPETYTRDRVETQQVSMNYFRVWPTNSEPNLGY